MKTIKNYSWFLVVSFFLMMVSCTEDADFSQLEDATLRPVFELDFIFSNFDTADFLPDDLPAGVNFEVPRVQLQDTVNYELIGTDFAVDHLERIELTIEVQNTVERPFELRFQFLSEADQPLGQLYTIQVQAGQGPGTQPVVSPQANDPNHPIILNNADFVELSNSQKVATEIIAPTLNSDLRGAVKIRSKATYFINYDL